MNAPAVPALRMHPGRGHRPRGRWLQGRATLRLVQPRGDRGNDRGSNEEEEEAADRRERILMWTLIAITLVGILTWIAWSLSAERRAIAGLPAEERGRIFAHTRETVETMCRDPSEPSLRSRCREQAEFLLMFPECDRDCEALIAPLLRHATR